MSTPTLHRESLSGVSGRAPGDPFLRQELRGAPLVAGRTIVALYSFLAIVVYLRCLPGLLHEQALIATVLSAAAAVSWTALAALVFVRRSRDLLWLLLSASFLSYGIVVGTFVDTNGLIAAGRSNPWAPPWPATIILIANALSLPWAYYFPDGRFVPRWTVALAAVWIAVWLVPAVGGPLLNQTPLGSRGLTILVIALVVSTALSCTFRYWRRSNAVQRQQLKWILLGALAFLAVYLVVVPTGALLPHQNPSAQAYFFQTLHSALFSLAVIAIPIAVGVAIFRQGLLDIDRIINRTLTYGAVTLILATGLVGISGIANATLEALTGQRSNLVLLASVVPVALAFTPLRARALKIADRYVVDSKVATLLFVDIVGSTDRAYAIGDRAWRDLLERFRSTVRRCLHRYGGKEIDTTGDGFFVTFEAPERAIRCAQAVIDSVKPLGLEVRAGVHIGEVQVDGTHVEGANVHLASRVMSEAGPGEILVSGALRDVVAGSTVDLRDRGARQLKGVPGEVALYAAAFA